MKKNIIQDIKLQKGNLITMLHKESSHYKESASVADESKDAPKELHIYKRPKEEKFHATSYSTKKTPRTRKSLFRIFFLVLILCGAYGCISYFENTHVVVTAKHQALVLDRENFTASKDTNAVIPFEIMIVSNEELKDMVLTESAEVSLKAKGEITLFNEWSTKPVKVAAKSIISDEALKAYTLDQAVTIPGFTTVNGKIVPGQVNVLISAFLVGDAYNGSPANFTINAFKGSVKFKQIYGTLKKPLTGGATGLVYTLDPTTSGMLHGAGESSFKNNLLKKTVAQVPPGYILYPNAFVYEYHVDDGVMSSTPNAKVLISGTLSAFLLKEKDLANAIREKELSSISLQERKSISVSDVRALSFNFTNPSQSIDKDMQSVQFALSGSLDAVWATDVETLRKSIAGVSKDSISSVFKTYPGIANASVKIFPPWQAHLPYEEKKINISVQ